jgi:hypothetical protein
VGRQFVYLAQLNPESKIYLSPEPVTADLRSLPRLSLLRQARLAQAGEKIGFEAITENASVPACPNAGNG